MVSAEPVISSSVKKLMPGHETGMIFHAQGFQEKGDCPCLTVAQHVAGAAPLTSQLCLQTIIIAFRLSEGCGQGKLTENRQQRCKWVLASYYPILA